MPALLARLPGFLFAALVLLALPGARADDFADCGSEIFKLSTLIDPASPFACSEIARETVQIGSNSVIVRAVRASTLPEAKVKPLAEEAVDVIASALVAYGGMPAFDFKFGNLTVLLSDPDNEFVGFTGHNSSGILADANPWTIAGECVVRYRTTALGQAEINLRRVSMAHEAFHCVQGWTYPKQTLLGDKSNRWWMEGTAEFFAHLVHEDAARLTTLGYAFNKEIQTKPLTSILYPSVVFHAYLYQQGPEKLAALLKMLPITEGEHPQMRAIIDTVGYETLNRFAAAMVDGTIAMPSGFRFPALPEPATDSFSADGETTFAEVPLTVETRNLHISGGDYALMTGPIFLARDQQGGEWADLPFQVTLEDCQDVKMLKLARFVDSAVPPDQPVPLLLRQTRKCWTCEKRPSFDSCLVGKWRLDNDAVLSWLQGKKLNEQMNYLDVKGKVFLVVNSSGAAQWVAEGVAVDAYYKPKDLSNEVFTLKVEMDGIESGAVSNSDQILTYCAESSQSKLTVTIQTIHLGKHVFTESQAAKSMELSYTCTPDFLVVKYVGPSNLGAESPSWEFSRAK